MYIVLILVYAPYLIRVDLEQTSATQNSPQRQADDPMFILLHFSKQVSSIAKSSGKPWSRMTKKRENCTENLILIIAIKVPVFSRLLVKTRICLSQVTDKMPWGFNWWSFGIPKTGLQSGLSRLSCHPRTLVSLWLPLDIKELVLPFLIIDIKWCNERCTISCQLTQPTWVSRSWNLWQWTAAATLTVLQRTMIKILITAWPRTCLLICKYARLWKSKSDPRGHSRCNLSY